MKILFFGITKDISGQREINDFQISKGDTVGNLMKELGSRYPELNKLTSIAVGVNQKYATMDTKLDNNDTVALIPPVSGG